MQNHKGDSNSVLVFPLDQFMKLSSVNFCWGAYARNFFSLISSKRHLERWSMMVPENGTTDLGFFCCHIFFQNLWPWYSKCMMDDDDDTMMSMGDGAVIRFVNASFNHQGPKKNMIYTQLTSQPTMLSEFVPKTHTITNWESRIFVKPHELSKRIHTSPLWGKVELCHKYQWPTSSTTRCVLGTSFCRKPDRTCFFLLMSAMKSWSHQRHK